MIRLDGKVALVTGATQGLGADIAASLVAAGASVMIIGLGREKGESVAARLGGACLFRETDITDDDAIDACLAEAAARFGRLDFLVNNACSYADPGLEASRADWMALLSVNLVGAALMIARAAPILTAPGGAIVNIGSVGGKFGAAGRLLYPASKAGLMQVTRNAAATLAPRGIRVLTVSPAWTWSPALKSMAGSPEHADAIGGAVHPLGRVGRGEDVGKVVAFACSDAAGFMTGVDLPVDGGFSMLGPDRGLSPRAWFAAAKDDGDG